MSVHAQDQAMFLSCQPLELPLHLALLPIILVLQRDGVGFRGVGGRIEHLRELFGRELRVKRLHRGAHFLRQIRVRPRRRAICRR